MMDKVRKSGFADRRGMAIAHLGIVSVRNL
jgi:hypothetical protein